MKARVVIGALVASNIALAAVVAYQAMAKDDGLYADHVQQLRMDVQNRVLRVQLGRSSTEGGPSVIDPRRAGTLLLTPRAAIQLEVQLSNMIAMVQQAADAQRSTSQGAVSQSADQSL